MTPLFVTLVLWNHQSWIDSKTESGFVFQVADVTDSTWIEQRVISAVCQARIIMFSPESVLGRNEAPVWLNTANGHNHVPE
jgi:hypothetical protein